MIRRETRRRPTDAHPPYVHSIHPFPPRVTRASLPCLPAAALLPRGVGLPLTPKKEYSLRFMHSTLLDVCVCVVWMSAINSPHSFLPRFSSPDD